MNKINSLTSANIVADNIELLKQLFPTIVKEGNIDLNELKALLGETVEEKEMPDEAYTLFGLHKEANLTDAQRATLVNWARTQMDTIKAHYPADSLVMKKKH